MFSNIWQMMLQATLFAKGILLILFLISVGTWAIMIKKYLRFRKLDKQASQIKDFVLDKTAPEILKLRSSSVSHPYIRTLKKLQNEILDYRNSQNLSDEAILDIFSEIEVRRVDMIQEELRALRTQIMNDEEEYVGFLATAAGVCPFLGLLGTVWGITEAFWQIGMQSSASLPVVAPGLAEALVTTIAGLTAAIPAVMGYNYFMGKLRRLDGNIETFLSRLISIFKKETI